MRYKSKYKKFVFACIIINIFPPRLAKTVPFVILLCLMPSYQASRLKFGVSALSCMQIRLRTINEQQAEVDICETSPV